MTQDPREAQLSDILYAVGMESQEACFHMERLCRELKIPYPPKRMEPVQRVVMLDPLLIGKSAPVTLACH